MWRDPLSGTWHANDDACPHRLAPLSEGRVEIRKGGNGGRDCETCVLACAYHGALFIFLVSFRSFSFIPYARAYNEHNNEPTKNSTSGWEFDTKGKCNRIPQLEDDASAKATALASPRSRLRSFPVCVKAGLVFVWPDAEPGAEERAERAAPPPVPAEVVDKVEVRNIVFFLQKAVFRSPPSPKFQKQTIA